MKIKTLLLLVFSISYSQSALAEAAANNPAPAKLNSNQTKTLVVEYPIIISPYVEEYQNCLKYGEYVVGDGSNFANQYNLDIIRCEKKSLRLLKEAKNKLSLSKEKGRTYDYDPEIIFDNIRQVHLWRGRNLDTTANTTSSVDGLSAKENEINSICYKQTESLRNERRDYMQAQEQNVEKIRNKKRYSKEDKQVLYSYQSELAAFNMQISFEMRKCVSKAYSTESDITNIFDNAKS